MVTLPFASLLPDAAQASCTANSAETRLQSFCLIEESKGKLMLRETLMALDSRIKREGYARGLGLPGHAAAHTSTFSVTPILDYSSNVNGGNPARPLVLGELTFDGDPDFYRKEGVLAGVGASTSGRLIYGPGRYADYSIGASYLHSPGNDAAITRVSLNACSKNQIVALWFVDACASGSRIDRELSDDLSRAVTLSAVRLLKQDSSYHQFKGGLRRAFAVDYEQNQFVFGIETIRPRGVYTSIEGSIGEAIENELATRQSLSATIGTTFGKRPLRATLSLSHSDGGKLLGIDRADQSQSISVSYTLTPRLTLSLGYRQTDSSIDYFDDAEPTFGIQFAPTAF